MISRSAQRGPRRDSQEDTSDRSCKEGKCICRLWRSDPTAFLPAAYNSCLSMHLLQCSIYIVDVCCCRAGKYLKLLGAGLDSAQSSDPGPAPLRTTLRSPSGIGRSRHPSRSTSLIMLLFGKTHVVGMAGKGTKRLTHLGFLSRWLGASELVGLLTASVEAKIAVGEMLDGMHDAISGPGRGDRSPSCVF